MGVDVVTETECRRDPQNDAYLSSDWLRNHKVDTSHVLLSLPIVFCHAAFDPQTLQWIRRAVLDPNNDLEPLGSRYPHLPANPGMTLHHAT